MRADALSAASAVTVTGAIQRAAKATGTSFQYLLATAQVESGLDPSASASTSSAKGLYQFIDQTWLGTMKSAGASLGYGRYADAISQTADGSYRVADPGLRKEILALRQDPTANAALAGALTKHNGELLTAALGRAPSEGELYMAHFLGAGGASKLIALAQSKPDTNAAALFPGAAHANRSIFYDHGAARSTSEVYQELARRYDHAVAAPTPAATVALAFAAQERAAPAAAVPVSQAAMTAATATAGPAKPTVLAEPAAAAADLPASAAAFVTAIPDGRRVATEAAPVFYGLFHDNPHGPVSPVVAALWGGSETKDAIKTAAAATGPAAAAVASPATAPAEPAGIAPVDSATGTATVAATTATATSPEAARAAVTVKPVPATGGFSGIFDALARGLRQLFGG